MYEQSLNGIWEYWVGNGKKTTIDVPFSRLPVGQSHCALTFDLKQTATEHMELVFDGITYHATVTLNDTVLGEMLPYCEYIFDVTSLVKPYENRLQVDLEDIALDFGPTEGWENYGGIIRDVHISYRGDCRIEDVFFHTKIKNNYRDADVYVDLCIVGGQNVEVTLFDGETPICCKTASADSKTVQMSALNIKLWSPDAPNLYMLQVDLKTDDTICETKTFRVGFREITCDRHHVLLNGVPLFLCGVCKHEMVGDCGHIVTRDQVRQDLELIRQAGCNFVRLVHYPHAKIVLELADEMGLMVSEEPGLWWSDTSNPVVANSSLEVLRRTILRDRNHACIAFWLSFNECRFTRRFLIDSVQICRKYDPTRLVSGANCMNDEDTLIYYNECGFDFYTMHPYSPSFDRAAKSAGLLVDKPLIFTEWGGTAVYDNPHLLSDFIMEMGRLYREASDEGALAGAFFWCFAEIY